MNNERSKHRTQWAAQFAVASELCKRNYQVALTLGNHPKVDLMAISPIGARFLVEVKGQYQKRYWQLSGVGYEPVFLSLFISDAERCACIVTTRTSPAPGDLSPEQRPITRICERDQRPKPCGRRLSASAYPGRVLSFTLIPSHLGTVG